MRPGQRVNVRGDATLKPRWGSGSFTVQQRGSLSLTSMVMPTVNIEGGELTLASITVPSAFFQQMSLQQGKPGSVVRLSEVTVQHAGMDLGTQSGTLTVGAGEDATLFDPPELAV